MKNILLTFEELDRYKPEDIVVAFNIGSDDVLTVDGREMMDKYPEINPKGTPLSKALPLHLADISGNSYDVLILDNGEIKKVSLKWPD